jgi:hypothetical protein
MPGTVHLAQEGLASVSGEDNLASCKECRKKGCGEICGVLKTECPARDIAVLREACRESEGFFAELAEAQQSAIGSPCDRDFRRASWIKDSEKRERRNGVGHGCCC